MNFKYVTLANDNRIMQGKIEATDEHLVEEWLQQTGSKVISIRPAPESRLLKLLLPRNSKVGQKELSLLFQQLATLLGSGVPLLVGMQLLRNEARNSSFQDLLATLITDLKSGESLHASLSKHSKVIPRIYISMIEAGERSGNLEITLRAAATHLQKELALKQRIRKALTYPAIVTGVGLVVIGLLVTVVLPTITDLLSRFGTDLPFISQVVINFSEFMQAWNAPVILSVVALAGLTAWYLRTLHGRRVMARILLRAPGVSRITVQSNLAHFSRTMSLLLKSGLSLQESLAMAGDTASNPAFREAISRVRTQVIQGRALSQAFDVAAFIPGLYAQIVRIGEESGTLEGNLTNMADFYEREVEEQLNNMVSFLEPAMTIALGVIVALVGLAVLLPMFKLYSTISQAS
jgi:type IV pilus assembly protein PilC